MGENSKIEWCDHTFNPWVGCTKVSPACDFCYAEGWAKRTGQAHLWNGERRRTTEAYWRQPKKWNRDAAPAGVRKRVFCASLADVFDNEVPQEWRDDLFFLIHGTPNLTWLLLTKRIGNVGNMLPVPFDFDRLYPNVWLGATIVTQEEADRDIPKLLAVPVAKRFLSIEPMLGPVDVFSEQTGELLHTSGNEFDPGHIDWIIVGGESDQPGMRARQFNLDWARSIVAQCSAAGVACFVKQVGNNARCAERERTGYRLDPVTGIAHPRLITKDRAGADPSEWPEDLRVQQIPPPMPDWSITA